MSEFVLDIEGIRWGCQSMLIELQPIPKNVSEVKTKEKKKNIQNPQKNFKPGGGNQSERNDITERHLILWVIFFNCKQFQMQIWNSLIEIRTTDISLPCVSEVVGMKIENPRQ